MRDIKVILFYEIGRLAIYLNGKAAFSNVPFKDQAKEGSIFVLLNAFDYFTEPIVNSLQIQLINQLKEFLNQSTSITWDEYVLSKNCFKDVFGSWGPGETRYFVGLNMCFKCSEEKCVLYDLDLVWKKKN